MRKQFTLTLFAVLLLLFLFPSARVDAARLKAEKQLEDGYTLICYTNLKTQKTEYAVIDLVIRKKVAGTVIASQLKNRYRPGTKTKFFFDGKETAHRKSGKAVRLNCLKKGTRIRVTFDYDKFKEWLSLELARVIPNPEDPRKTLYFGVEIPEIYHIDVR